MAPPVQLYDRGQVTASHVSISTSGRRMVVQLRAAGLVRAKNSPDTYGTRLRAVTGAAIVCAIRTVTVLCR